MSQSLTTFKRPASMRALLAAACLAIAAVSPGTARAQADQEPAQDPNTVAGKLVEVKKAGRSTVLVVETGDKETKEFQLPPRASVEITAKGDDGFLKIGQFVSAMPVLTNEKLFGKEFTVHVGPGRKTGVLAKAPQMAGVSLAAYQVAGQIASRQQDEEYPDYEVLTLRIGKQTVPVYLDEGYSVTVRLSDVDHAQPGSSITIQGKPGPRDRFTVTAVEIGLAEPLKAEEFFTDDKPSRKKRGAGKRDKPAAKEKPDDDE